MFTHYTHAVVDIHSAPLEAVGLMLITLIILYIVFYNESGGEQ